MFKRKLVMNQSNQEHPRQKQNFKIAVESNPSQLFTYSRLKKIGLIKLLGSIQLALFIMSLTMKLSTATDYKTYEYKGYSLLPLLLKWDSSRGDNLTYNTILACLNNSGRIDIDRDCYQSGKYRTVRTEGCVVLSRRGPGNNVKLRRLELFWHPKRKDFVTVATERSKQEQIVSGYVSKGFQGFVFTEQLPGTIPLWLYWFGGRTDNATGATWSFHRDQRQTEGMERVRIEGYVFPAYRCSGD